jgi:hypothetical protein
MFSDFMATFFANMLPYIVLMQAGAYCWFMFTIANVSSVNYYYISSKDNNGPAIAALLIALICLICPWRSYIDSKVDKDDVNSKNKSRYNKVVLTFQTDYDRENPLTKKQGETRILDILLEEANKGTDK